MNDEVIKYSLKYKNHQKRLIFILMLILIIFGVLSIGFGIFLCFSNYDKLLIFVGLIMILFGGFDIPLSIKFYKYGIKKISSYTDIEAYKRYLKIYGIKKEIEDEEK